MGINGINTLIKRSASDAFFTMPLNEFSGKRVAVDANNWMYTNMATARKKVVNRTDVAVQEPNLAEIRREWFLSAINFILGWLSYNITPVFVFDGRHPPEKDKTKAERRDKRIASRAKIDALYAQLRGNILEKPANIVEELRKELRNYNYILPEDFELFKTVMRGIGIPCLQANADGEQLCSMLCIEGKVAAVFSVDTDNLVYGCPLVINRFSETYTYDEYGGRVAHVDCVRLDRVIGGLGISHSMFVDLCIMSGCDFNTNMPGYAAIKSYGLLKKFGTIDDLPRNLDTTCLNHNRCRELFKYQSSDEIVIKDDLPVDDVEQDQNLEPNPLEGLNVNNQPINPLDINKTVIATAREYLDMAGVSGQIDRIIAAYHQVIPPQDGTVDRLELAPIARYVPLKRVMLNIVGRSPAMPIMTVPLPNVPQPTATIVPNADQLRFLTLNVLPTIPPMETTSSTVV
ncbi:FLAP endonuclease [uncultured virus]|nr:FLAP endonuclease [uncultured virus]